MGPSLLATECQDISYMANGINASRGARVPSIEDDEESIRIVPSLTSASHHSKSSASVKFPTIQSYVSKHQAHHHRRSQHPYHHREQSFAATANPSEPPPPPAESEVGSPDTPHQLHVAQQAGNAARERFDTLQRTSQLTHRPTDLVLLSWNEIFVEELLGIGGFACVCLVNCPKLWKKHKRTYLQRKWNNSQHQHSSDLASVDSSLLPPSEDSWMSCSVETNGEKYYACKCLSSRTIQRGYNESCNIPASGNCNPDGGSRNMYSVAAADLVGEAFLLSKLSHPNIVRLYGVSSGDIDQAFLHKGGFFFIMEALTSVLDDVLQDWRNLKQGQITSVGDFLRQSTEQIPGIQERLAIALEIATGMEYCHSQCIIFRDLKPHNVGTSREGGLRLFDFGLARESPSGMCRGKAGSLRYMAPETIANKFTCYASDVYAFGIVLWELLSLERPPNQNNEMWDEPNDFERAVCIDGFRPPLTEQVIESDAIRELIKSCWQEDFQRRPTFIRIIDTLQELLQTGNNQRDMGPKNRPDRANSRAWNGLGDDGDRNSNNTSRNSLGSSFQSLMNDSLMSDCSHSKASAITMESARRGRGRSVSSMPPTPAHVDTETVEKMTMSPPPPRKPKGPRRAPMEKSESETTVTISNTARKLQSMQDKVSSMRNMVNNDTYGNCHQHQSERGNRTAISLLSQNDEGSTHGNTILNRAPRRWQSDQHIDSRLPMKPKSTRLVAEPPLFIRSSRQRVHGASSVASGTSGTSEGTSGSRSSFASSHSGADLDDAEVSRSKCGSPTNVTATPTLTGAIRWQRRRNPSRPPYLLKPNQTQRSHSEQQSLMDAMMDSSNH